VRANARIKIHHREAIHKHSHYSINGKNLICGSRLLSVKGIPLKKIARSAESRECIKFISAN